MELQNEGNTAAALEGWSIDDGKEGSAPVQVSPDTVIPPGTVQRIMLQQSMLNTSGGTLRLLTPNLVVADSAAFTKAAADGIFCHAAGDTKA